MWQREVEGEPLPGASGCVPAALHISRNGGKILAAAGLHMQH
jgi:hypothetical protein